jgi:hypothetical protein
MGDVGHGGYLDRLGVGFAFLSTENVLRISYEPRASSYEKNLLLAASS